MQKKKLRRRDQEETNTWYTVRGEIKHALECYEENKRKRRMQFASFYKVNELLQNMTNGQAEKLWD